MRDRFIRIRNALTITKTVPNGSGAEEMRDRSIRIRNALTMARWFSAWTKHNEGVGSNPALCQEK